MRSGVLSIGTITVDYAKKIDHLPELEALVTIDEVSSSTGGPGLNIAFDIKQLDPQLRIEAIGCLGKDANGKFIIDQSSKIGLINDRMQTSSNPQSGFTDAMILKSNGKRTFLFHIGSNNDLDFDVIDIDLHKPKILHLGAPGVHSKMDKVDANGESGWVRVLKRAKSLGIHTNLEMIHLDAESEKALVLPCLPYLSSIIINESEAGALVDIPFKVDGADSDVDWITMELIASKLITLGVSQLAVIHTPAGCVAADSTGKTWRQGSVKVPLSQIKGTSGAGDAFAAGVVYGIHQAWPVQDCLELGVATAAQNIQSDKTAADIAQYETTLSQSRSLGYRNTSK